MRLVPTHLIGRHRANVLAVDVWRGYQRWIKFGSVVIAVTTRLGGALPSSLWSPTWTTLANGNRNSLFASGWSGLASDNRRQQVRTVVPAHEPFAVAMAAVTSRRPARSP